MRKPEPSASSASKNHRPCRRSFRSMPLCTCAGATIWIRKGCRLNCRIHRHIRCADPFGWNSGQFCSERFVKAVERRVQGRTFEVDVDALDFMLTWPEGGDMSSFVQLAFHYLKTLDLK